MLQVIPDPDFDDPAAWTFVGSGASITGGQLRFVNAAVVSSDTVPHIVAIPGRDYKYVIDVAAYQAGAITERILFGGTEIYSKNGIGTFTGDFVATTNDGLIFQASLAGQWFLNSIEIVLMDAREEQIMQAIKTACTGLTTTGANAFRGRAYPIAEAELPGVVIYGGPDTLQAQLSSGYLDWALQVSIEAYVRTSVAVVDTLLTEIRKEVYTAIMTTPQLGLAYVIDTIPLQAYEPEIDGTGNQPIAKRRMEFTVQYRTSRTDISA